MNDIDVVIQSLGGLSYGGVFILAILSNIVIPVPEEIILLVMGYLTGIGAFQYPLVLALFIMGMLLSDYVLYSLAKRGSRITNRLQARIEKKGYLKNKDYLQKHINKIIFFSRFLVYLRFIGPVVSGTLQIPRKKFLTYDFLALVLYVNLFLGLGNYFHAQLSVIIDGVARFKNYLLLAATIIISLLVLRYIQKNFMKWMRAVTEYVPTIIPGLERKEDE